MRGEVGEQADPRGGIEFIAPHEGLQGEARLLWRDTLAQSRLEVRVLRGAS